MKKLIDFDKEGFKKEVITNVKTLYRRPIEEATPQQVFQAVSYAVKDDIIDRWIATHKEYEKKNVKTVYYLSMEFLMGRALGNNLINLTYYDAVKEALDELGFDFIGTTMVGYTEQSKGDKIEANDFEILREIVSKVNHKVIAEGNINTPEKARRVLELGAYSVVVGSIITRPQLITKSFVEEMKKLEA